MVWYGMVWYSSYFLFAGQRKGEHEQIAMEDGRILQYNNKFKTPFGIHKYWLCGRHRADVRCKFRITTFQDRVIKSSGMHICVARPEQIKVTTICGANFNTIINQPQHCKLQQRLVLFNPLLNTRTRSVVCGP